MPSTSTIHSYDLLYVQIAWKTQCHGSKTSGKHIWHWPFRRIECDETFQKFKLIGLTWTEEGISDCNAACRALSLSPVSTDTDGGNTTYVCAFNSDGYRGGFNIQGDSVCWSDMEGKTFQCLCNSANLHWVNNEAGKFCDETCSSNGLHPVFSGNHGQEDYGTFYICLQSVAGIKKAGWMLKNNGTSCSVSGGGSGLKECLCQGKNLVTTIYEINTEIRAVKNLSWGA